MSTRPVLFPPVFRLPSLAFAAALAGCGLAHERPHGASDASTARTVAYVVSAMRTGPRDDAGTVGLDMDIRVDGPAGHCDGVPDHRSPLSGTTGIDNQLPALLDLVARLRGADVSLDEGLATRIAAGGLLLGIEVGDVDDFTNDAAVTVRVLRLRPAEGTSVPLGPDGVLVGGGRYAIDADLGTYVARISEGVLEARTVAAFDLLSLVPATAPLRVGFLSLRAPITPDRLDAAELGGSLRPREVADELRDAGLAVDLASLSRAGLPDLEPSADGAHCDGLSVGLAIDGVLATLETP